MYGAIRFAAVGLATFSLFAQQTDKTLFDRAMKDIEGGDYDHARLTLNDLISVDQSSGYVVWAKLAIAGSWFREGGAHGLAQADAEYKDFALFYPNIGDRREHITVAARGLEGRVMLSAIVSKDGVPGSFKVLNDSGNQALAAAAVEAAMQRRYSPALVNGDPIEVLSTIQVDFKVN